MRKTNKIIIGIVLIAIMLLGIGYAAIQNITLNIKGTATADPNQANFKVKFSGTPTTSDTSKVTAKITDDVNATINVSGLTSKGETVTATYTVQNASTDISADLSVATTNSNTEYFTLKAELAKTSLVAGEETTLTVTVELTKTPISETVNTTIGVQLTAAPVEPGQEGTSGNINGSSQTPNGSTILSEPYLPTGFSHVSGTSLETGYVIQDSTGNQYVWVEVPQTAEVYPTAGLEVTDFTSEEYTKIENDLHTYTSVYRKGTSNTDTWYSEDQHGLTETQYNELKQKMLKSVYQNGGFYVGRYEMGIDYSEGPRTTSGNITQTPVIKQNAYPYNNVTNKQAQQLASRMESGGYTTSLMFGVQWDLVLKYLETKGATQAELNSNSTNWGNYANNQWTVNSALTKYYKSGAWSSTPYSKTSNAGVLLTTGADSMFSKQNIFDLAGNVFELTLEKKSDSSSPCVYRGGCYVSYDYEHPASNRSFVSTTHSTGRHRRQAGTLLIVALCHGSDAPNELAIGISIKIREKWEPIRSE